MGTRIDVLPNDVLRLILEHVKGGPCNQVCKRWRRVLGAHKYSIKHYTTKSLAVIAAMCGYMPKTYFWSTLECVPGPAKLLEYTLEINQIDHEFVEAIFELCPGFKNKFWPFKSPKASEMMFIIYYTNPPQRPSKDYPMFKDVYLALCRVGLVDIAVVLTALKICTDQGIQ